MQLWFEHYKPLTKDDKDLLETVLEKMSAALEDGEPGMQLSTFCFAQRVFPTVCGKRKIPAAANVICERIQGYTGIHELCIPDS